MPGVRKTPPGTVRIRRRHRRRNGHGPGLPPKIIAYSSSQEDLDYTSPWEETICLFQHFTETSALHFTKRCQLDYVSTRAPLHRSKTSTHPTTSRETHPVVDVMMWIQNRHGPFWRRVRGQRRRPGHSRRSLTSLSPTNPSESPTRLHPPEVTYSSEDCLRPLSRVTPCVVRLSSTSSTTQYFSPVPPHFPYASSICRTRWL